jgi:hypothetical protein
MRNEIDRIGAVPGVGGFKASPLSYLSPRRLTVSSLAAAAGYRWIRVGPSSSMFALWEADLVCSWIWRLTLSKEGSLPGRC